MGPLLKERFMFNVSENAKTSFFVKSNVVAFVRVTNALGKKEITCPLTIIHMVPEVRLSAKFQTRETASMVKYSIP